MANLSERLARCPEMGCVVRGAHEFHSDGKGRTWAFRDLPLPAWRVKAEKDLAERGWVAVKETE